jgi:hypothetical protein
MTLRLMPGLGLIKGEAISLRFEVPRQLDNDDVVLAVCLSGESRFKVRGREPTLVPGEAILTGAGEASICDLPVHCRFITLRAPGRALASIRTPGDLVGRPIPAATPALGLLRNYVGILDEVGPMADAAAARRGIVHPGADGAHPRSDR